MLEKVEETKCMHVPMTVWKGKVNNREFIIRGPQLFAAYSMWGNQWLKLLLFYNDWCNRVNLLISCFDILMSTKERKQKSQEMGIRGLMMWQREMYIKKIKETLSKKFAAYRDYLKYTEVETPTFNTNLIMLDSGGFSLDTETNVSKFIEEGFSIKYPSYTQKKLLRLQAKMEPDIILTLDRVIKNPNRMSIKEKEERINFNLKCAKAALETKAEMLDNEEFNSLLFAVIHPFGPKIDNLSNKIINYYLENCASYVGKLIDFEQEIGEEFDGFAVGSLISLPLEIVMPIGEAIFKQLRFEKGRDVFLHGLGVTNIKARHLLRIGFQTFDTNMHVKLARNKWYLLEDEDKKVVKIDELEVLNCQCPICRTHPISEFRERRRGVAEVSTVLLSLHNFFVYEKKLISPTSQVIQNDL
jgi:queuine/archaeosine tRNA-ribosyltransferase